MQQIGNFLVFLDQTEEFPVKCQDLRDMKTKKKKC